MREQDPQRAELRAQDLLSGRVVVVAVDVRDRRKLAQRAQDVRAADVPGVNDPIDVRENRRHLPMQYAVRIGDDADA